MEQTIKTAFANTFVMYFKAHVAHWNVEGILFGQFHDFFQEMYEDIYGAIDPFAEEIRKLNFYAPHTMDNLYSFKNIAEDPSVKTVATELLADLESSNSQVIESLNILFNEAEAANEQGLADFVAGRLDSHKKHGWMLRSYLK
jgi:starvation-inducible DNA-binding protein